MSIFDVLTNGTLGSVIDTITKQAKTAASGFGDSLPGGIGSVLDSISSQARSAASDLSSATPGGLGGLAGAGALGAILGNVIQGDLMKSIAMAGAGAVAWNFYKKWAAGQQADQEPARQAPPAQSIPASTSGWGNLSTPPKIDPTAQLVIRSMLYAARADGTIDATEQNRIDQILHNMLPGQDVSQAVEIIRKEDIDPTKIAAQIHSPEQAEDVYRLSCAVIDVDNFMEKSYLDALSRSLGINAATKQQLEAEANQAKSQLRAALTQ